MFFRGFGLMYDRLRIDWDFCTYPAFPTQNISVGATGSVDAQTAFEQLETKANQKWETILS